MLRKGCGHDGDIFVKACVEASFMLNALLDIFVPPVCPLCEEAIKKGALCGDCLALFEKEKISGPFCTTCGEPFASDTGGAHRCGRCSSVDPPFVEARSAFLYEGRVRDAVHSFKYGGRVTLGVSLALLMCGTTSPPKDLDLIVPVPLHRERLKSRGYNQSLLIARAVSKIITAPLDCLHLRKTRLTADQVDLTAREREENVRGAFEADASAFKNKTVLLIDDVLTTGSTVRECSKTLSRAGARVFILTLARAASL
ncbi:MAG TPA: amidophosphoribosyltransferase [Deltaproteobacteria bacterium]|nr:amidophosphoribosyltransferase [Deltaproteobacteria bacterium]